MTDLTDFLLARITDDEEVARDTGFPGYERERQYGNRFWSYEADYSLSDAEFVSTFDPTHVLAECAAKRRIVDLHRMVGKGSEILGVWLECEADSEIDDAFIGGCPTLRILAAVYADHPDYRAEWAL